MVMAFNGDVNTDTAQPTNATSISNSGNNSSWMDNVLNHYQTDVQTPWAWNPTAQNKQQYSSQVNNQVTDFQSQFYNLVGRNPTSDEVNQFVNSYIIPNTNNLANPNTPQSTNPDSYIQQFVGANFHKAANDYATQQLQDQQSQWQGLAKSSLDAGNTAIDATKQSLLDYQNNLFQRIQPNLLTSLKSQGFLDTGGLNEAVAGVQGDLANNASNYIAQLQLQNQQQANNISLSGQAAPISFAQGNITNQPSYLNSAGNNAATFNNNTFMDNLNYQHQLGLIGAQTNAQASLQPSFLRTLGQSTANSIGNSFGQWVSPNVGGQSGSSGAAAMTMFA